MTKRSFMLERYVLNFRFHNRGAQSFTCRQLRHHCGTSPCDFNVFGVGFI